MAYSGKADILKVLNEDTVRQLTDDDNQGQPNDARISEAITMADAEIELYCGAYSLPFDPVPHIIKKISVDIAIYNLYARVVDEVPPIRQERYNNAVDMLKAVAQGTANLNQDQVTDSVACNKTEGDRVMTGDTLKTY